MMFPDLDRVWVPALIRLSAISILLGVVVTMTIQPHKKQLKELKKEIKIEEKKYIKHIDSLNIVIHFLDKEIIEDQEDIIKINNIRDETIDSLMQLDFNDKLKFLSNRFNISTQIDTSNN